MGKMIEKINKSIEEERDNHKTISQHKKHKLNLIAYIITVMLCVILLFHPPGWWDLLLWLAFAIVAIYNFCLEVDNRPEVEDELYMQNIRKAESVALGMVSVVIIALGVFSLVVKNMNITMSFQLGYGIYSAIQICKSGVFLYLDRKDLDEE